MHKQERSRTRPQEQQNNHLFCTLISLPGSVAIPSFQSRASIMLNSAPWEGPSLGGVSVIPTPLIWPTCKESHGRHGITLRPHKEAQSAPLTSTSLFLSTYRFPVHDNCSKAGGPLRLHPRTDSNLKCSSIPPCTCKQIGASSPLDGDCVLALQDTPCTSISDKTVNNNNVLPAN